MSSGTLFRERMAIQVVGWDNLIYGALLVAFIIFLPKGILGTFLERVRARR